MNWRNRTMFDGMNWKNRLNTNYMRPVLEAQAAMSKLESELLIKKAEIMKKSEASEAAPVATEPSVDAEFKVVNDDNLGD